MHSFKDKNKRAEVIMLWKAGKTYETIAAKTDLKKFYVKKLINKQKLNRPLPLLCQSRLRAGGYCKNLPLPGNEYCCTCYSQIHAEKDPGYRSELRTRNNTEIIEKIEHYWHESMILLKLKPERKLSNIFDFIHFCVVDEGIPIDIQEVRDWYKTTQSKEGQPVEILSPKYRFYFNNTPYKKILINGLPPIPRDTYQVKLF